MQDSRTSRKRDSESIGESEPGGVGKMLSFERGALLSFELEIFFFFFPLKISII